MTIAIDRGVTVDYETHGEGPPLVLINGLGFGRWGWFKQVPELSRRFGVVTFDVRKGRGFEGGVGELVGHTASLIEHLNLDRAHVMGASLGGFVAQGLALRRPDLVGRLVLVCTSYGGRGPERPSTRAMADMFGVSSFGPDFGPEKAARKGLATATSETYRAGNPLEFEDILHRRLADSPPLAAYYHQAMAGANFDASRAVGDISSPTLVIHGAQDRYVPASNAVALARAIPDARLRLLEDAGHLVFVERANEVNREVTEFLDPSGR